MLRNTDGYFRLFFKPILFCLQHLDAEQFKRGRHCIYKKVAEQYCEISHFHDLQIIVRLNLYIKTKMK